MSASKHNYNAVTPFEDRKNPDKEYTNYSWRRAASATNKDLAGRPFKKSMSRAGIIPLPTTRAAVAQDLKKFDEALGIVQDDGHGNIDLELSKSSGNDGTLLHSDQSSAGTSTNHSKSAGYLTSKQRMEPMPYRPHTAGVAPKQKFALVEEVDEQDMLNNLDPNVTDRYFSANAKERFARTCKTIIARCCSYSL